VIGLQASARSDIGKVRDNNEDAVLCLDHVVAVADGMGGHPGGEVASNLAIALVQAAFTGDSLPELEAAVRAANRAISDRAAANQDLEGMGSTICAVGTTGDGGLAVVNVGDTRAYLCRDGSLQQLTEDHSVVSDLVRTGQLSPEEAVSHPMRGVLTRALGSGPRVDVYGVVQAAAPGDRLLLCSDGLSNDVDEEEIAALMASDDVAVAADRLVERALANGGHDNVSVVVADVRAS
jgi:protein phosphatase